MLLFSEHIMSCEGADWRGLLGGMPAASACLSANSSLFLILLLHDEFAPHGHEL